MKLLPALLARIAAVVLLAIAAPLAKAEWLRAESDSFIVFAEARPDRLRQQVAVLEDYAALLRRISGTAQPPSPNKLLVYMLEGGDDLRAVLGSGRGVGGFYAATPHGIAAVVNSGLEGVGNVILFHEYAHHFMLQYHGAAYPPWYVEGFAEYMMTARFTDRHIEFGHADPMRARTLANPSRWIALERIMFEPGAIDPRDRGLYYAQSWLITHYLLSDSARTEQLRRYFSALGRGDEPRAAFQASFAKTPAELQREVERYAFGGRMSFLRMDRASIASAPQIETVALPRSADDLIPLHAALRLGGGNSDLLARVRRLAAGQDDAFSQRLLAQAEVLHGDGDAGERLLETLLAASPDDAELLYLRGMRHLVAGQRDEATRAARFRQARPWFVRAHRADSNHFQTLYRYAETFMVEPSFLSDNNAEVLLLSQRLAPQVAQIRMTAAAVLLARSEFDPAEILLRPLAGTAHEGRIAVAARGLLAKARARDSSGVAIGFEAVAPQ